MRDKMELVFGDRSYVLGERERKRKRKTGGRICGVLGDTVRCEVMSRKDKNSVIF